MSGVSTDLESLFGRFVERHVIDGEILAADQLCGGQE